VTASAVLDRAKLLAARLRAASDRPYLATALYSLSVVADQRVPTMGVDRHWRCYVNADFVAATPVPELAAVWIHEAAHLLRAHHDRADNLPEEYRHDHHRVNVAEDCEINDDLVADGLSLPDNRVDPQRLGLEPGLLFEAYLPHIPRTRYRLECGSGAHGHPMPWDVDGPAAARVGPVEADAIRRTTAEAIRAHQRSRGTVPGGWDRWATTVLEPTIDWRRALAGAVREAAAWASGAVDYTYRRPSRRAAAMRGVVLPTLRQPVPRVAVIVDTSGSMAEEDLRDAMGEVTGVLRAVGIGGNRVTVLACDADVHAARRVSSVDQVVLAGGGGTDMRVGIEAALRGPETPHVVVVLTDGGTPWPDAPLSTTRVIAALIGTNPPLPPAWIETVRVGQAGASAFAST
jgi:predicted metal-dependent peptidase